MTASKMNFYTQNGWAGSNYDSKLQTKDVAAKVRAFAKKNFPEFKFSITSRWSMYTDSLYIVLKSGPCVPFIEGSRRAERGYMQTMSSVKGWETDLTPELFEALDGVTSYASSFRYDDSDGMIDYFDTNFFLKIEVADDYKVIEPKQKKESPKHGELSSEANEGKASDTVVTPESLEIVDYSEKAIAVFGETKAIKEELKKLGGKFNPALKYNGEKRAGWIFSKKQAEKVRALLAPSVETVENVTLPELQKEIDITDALDEMSGTQDSEPVKLYNTSFGIGTSKYVVNFHDGIKRHNDGSRFYDIRIFSNKKEMVKFIKELEKEGYKLDTFFNESELEKEAKQESDRIAFAKASKEFIQEWRANNPYPGSDHLDEFNAKFNRDYSAFADKYGVSSYLVPSLCPTERGEYKETALDRQKKAADILVESIEGNWYTIRLNRQIELKSKRIKRYDNGCIAVPESVYNKLKDKYNVMCNF